MGQSNKALTLLEDTHAAQIDRARRRCAVREIENHAARLGRKARVRERDRPARLQKKLSGVVVRKRFRAGSRVGAHVVSGSTAKRETLQAYNIVKLKQTLSRILR